MVNHGTNHLGIDRSKTAGGRRRRMAAQRNRELYNSNLYQIGVNRVGLYQEGNKWKLTALHATRDREKLVSDRQGGATTERVSTIDVPSNNPRDGIVISTFDTKKEATSKYYTPNSWNKKAPGEYWGDSTFRSFKVDRDDWREWIHSRQTRKK